MQRTNIHPALTALETAMATMSAAQQQIEHSAQWVDRSFDEIDPARWTKKIEEAKPEDFERLLVLYDEKALSFMTSWLTQQGRYEHLFDSCTAICDALRDVLAAHDAIDDKSPDKWLKPIMQNRCIEAAELHHKPRPDRHVQDRDQTFTRAYGILTQAFTVLFESISAAGRVVNTRPSWSCRRASTNLSSTLTLTCAPYAQSSSSTASIRDILPAKSFASFWISSMKRSRWLALRKTASRAA